MTIGGAATSDIASVTYVYAYTLPTAAAESFSNEDFDNNCIRNAGTYAITATVAPTGDSIYDYNTLVLNTDIVVSRVAITNITFAGLSTVYDGEEKRIAVSASATQLGDPINVRYDVDTTNEASDYSVSRLTGVAATNAGSYEVTAYINENSLSNAVAYNINYFDFAPITRTLEISKATIANLTFVDATVTYDGAYYWLVVSEDSEHRVQRTSPSATVTVTPSGLSLTDVATVTYTISASAFTGAINAGSYNITATVSNRNYNVFSATATLTINPADMWARITGEEDLTDFYYFVSDVTQFYDTYTHFINVGVKASDGAATTDMFVVGDKAIVTSYYIRPEGLTLAQAADRSLMDTATITYTVSGSEFTGAKNAGTYYLRAVLTDANNNYNSVTLDGVLTINPLSFVDGNPLHPYDFTTLSLTGNDDLLYNGRNHYVGVTVNGTAGYLDSLVTSAPLLTADGSVDIVYEYSTSINGTYNSFNGVVDAGTYYIRARTNLDVDVLDNYVAWSETVELTILPVEIFTGIFKITFPETSLLLIFILVLF